MADFRIIGPFPPPYGGVAIHLVRLHEWLSKKGVVTAVESTKRSGGLDHFKHFWRCISSSSPSHYHTDEGNYKWLILFSLFWRLQRTKYILTFHSFRQKPAFKSRLVRFLLKRALEHAKAVVAISHETSNALMVTLRVDANVQVIGSALPISKFELNSAVWQSVPTEWLEAEHRVVVNAGRVVRYNGKDLYGIDVVLKAFSKVHSANDRVHLLVVLGTTVDASLCAEYLSLQNTIPNVHIVETENEPLLPIHKAATIVVRSTRTEGGPSLTLTEALELGRFAVGSDAVARPEGTFVYKTTDEQALADVIIRLCDGTTKPLTKEVGSKDAEALLGLYQAVGFVSTTSTPAEV